VDDQAGRKGKDLAGERELVGARLPEGRDPVVEHRVAEQPSGEPMLALERVEVPACVAARERQPRDEVVEDELVQDDDTRPAAERLEDPAVGRRVVTDVVEGDVAAGRAAEAAGPRDHDLDTARELGEEKRAVVGDPGPFGRERRVVGDLHASRRSMQESQVTCAAIARPARP
jgi:hypothetical protein